MRWLPRIDETFETNASGIGRPAAWATMAALVLAELVIIAAIVKALTGTDMAFPTGQVSPDLVE